jgi:hypothetical protein
MELGLTFFSAGSNSDFSIFPPIKSEVFCKQAMLFCGNAAQERLGEGGHRRKIKRL